LARYHFENQNYRQAVKAAQRALKLNGRKDGGSVQAILGKSLEKTQEFAKAIPELKKAEKMSPEDEKINFSLSGCYQKTDQIQLMNRELDKAFAKLKRRLRGF
jgi:tetratricopeptide (TPR) repeat protein